MRRAAGMAAVAMIVATLGVMADTARAEHPRPGFAVTPVRHPGGPHDWHHGGHPGPHHPRPPMVVHPVPVPPVYSYYPTYQVVPSPYYPAPYYPGGVISYQGRHVGITLGF